MPQHVDDTDRAIRHTDDTAVRGRAGKVVLRWRNDRRVRNIVRDVNPTLAEALDDLAKDFER